MWNRMGLEGASWIGLLLAANILGILVHGAPTERSKEYLDSRWLTKEILNHQHKDVVPEFERQLQNLKKWNPGIETPTPGPKTNGITPFPEQTQLVFGVAKTDSEGKDSLKVTPERHNLTMDQVNMELEHAPEDLAQYIFWTGDEPSVAWAVSDFVQDGIISREDAIGFLEEIRSNVNSLKVRYQPPPSSPGDVHGDHDHPSQSSDSSSRDSGKEERKDKKIKTFQDEFPEDEDSVGSSSHSKSQEISFEEVIYHLAQEIMNIGLQRKEREKGIGRLAHSISEGKVPEDLQKEIMILLDAAILLAHDQKGRGDSPEIHKPKPTTKKTHHKNTATKIGTKY